MLNVRHAWVAMVIKLHTAWPGNFAQISYKNRGFLRFFWEGGGVHEVHLSIVAYRMPYPIFAWDYKSDSKTVGDWSWFPACVSSAEIMNAWSYTYTSPYIFMLLCLKKHRKNLAERIKLKNHVRDNRFYLLKNWLFIRMPGLMVNRVSTNKRLKLI